MSNIPPVDGIFFSPPTQEPTKSNKGRSPISPLNPAYEKHFTHSTISSVTLIDIGDSPSRTDSISPPIQQPVRLPQPLPDQIIKQLTRTITLLGKLRTFLEFDNNERFSLDQYFLPLAIFQEMYGEEEIPNIISERKKIVLQRSISNLLVIIESCRLDLGSLYRNICNSPDSLAFEADLLSQAPHLYTSLQHGFSFNGPLGKLTFSTFYDRLKQSPEATFKLLEERRERILRSWDIQ